MLHTSNLFRSMDLSCVVWVILFLYPLPERDVFLSLSLSLTPIDRNAELTVSANVKTGLVAASCKLVHKPVIY